MGFTLEFAQAQFTVDYTSAEKLLQLLSLMTFAKKPGSQNIRETATTVARHKFCLVMFRSQT